MVLQGFAKDLTSDRVQRSVGPRVDEKGVPRGEVAAGVGHPKRIDGSRRELRVPEVEPPVQEAGKVVAIQLGPQNAVACRRHAEESVRHLIPLRHAVVGPQIGDAALDEGLDVVACRDRMPHESPIVVLDVGESIDEAETLQVTVNESCRGGEGLEMIGMRFVGDVEEALLQKLVDKYQTGIRISEVKLQSVLPPPQVQPAFDDVNVAIEEKARIINLAQAYEADIIPMAEGDATKIMESAEAYKNERIAIATGQAERFLTILEEYNKAPKVTRQRMYLEAMEEILINVSKKIVDEGTNVNVVVTESDGSVVPIPSSD